MLGYILYRWKLKNTFFFLVLVFGGIYIYQFILLPLSVQKHSKVPVIIWWTPFMFENEKLITCRDKYRCLLTKDRSYVNTSDLQAFLFYGSKFEYQDLPLPKHAFWAVFHEESPRNVAIFLARQTFQLFDIVGTFSRTSDFPLTLQYLENTSIITDTQYVQTLESKNKHLKSIAPVLYIQSDCDTPIERDVYVKELMNYIKVDSYGQCLNNKKFPKELSEIDPLDLYNEKLLRFIGRYKFVISFENAVCDDYITEKLWRPLMVGSIPIYMGSPSVKDWLPNDNSVILARNFTKPEELARYINKINKNDSLYRSFLKHKNGQITNQLLKNTLARGRFGIESDQDDLISAFECFVCQQIHQGVQKRHSGSVYDCERPKKGNSWEYFWLTGDCLSKGVVDFVKNGVEFKDFC